MLFSPPTPLYYTCNSKVQLCHIVLHWFNLRITLRLCVCGILHHLHVNSIMSIQLIDQWTAQHQIQKRIPLPVDSLLSCILKSHQSQLCLSTMFGNDKISMREKYKQLNSYHYAGVISIGVCLSLIKIAAVLKKVCSILLICCMILVRKLL